MQPAEIYLHIGLPKTGTTFLQSSVFPFLPEGYDCNPEALQPLIDEIDRLNNDVLRFEPNAQQNTNLKDLLEKVRIEYSGKKILISNEALSCLGYSGCYQTWMPFIFYFFPDAKILMFVRNPLKWMISMYRQSIQQGNFQSYKRFFYSDDNQIRPSLNTYQNGKLPKLNILQMDQEKLIAELDNHYGSDKVKVIAFETLKQDSNVVARQLESFFGLEPNSLGGRINSGVVYRSLSGLSITIILIAATLLAPVKQRLYYIPRMPLFANDNPSSKKQTWLEKQFLKFHWARVRKLFQDGLDKKLYLDIGFERRCTKYLEQQLGAHEVKKAYSDLCQTISSRSSVP